MDIARDEIELSQQQGFTQGWSVAEDYEIASGILRPKGAIRRIYCPIMHDELLNVLLKLERGNEVGLLRFARAYGHFGYSGLVPPEKRRGGDPVGWIWAHIETLQMCGRLLRWLREEDLNRLEASLCALQLSDQVRASVWRFLFFMRDDEAHWPATIMAARGEIIYRSWRALGAHTQQRFVAERELEELAEEVISSVIQANIGGISPEPIIVKRRRRQEIRTGFHFRALIEIVYWHLANALQGGRLWICEAEDCRAFFVQRSRGQRYCPRPYGEHGRSPCATRARQDRHQQRMDGRGRQARVPARGG
jgi:hypothetical protein